MINKVFEAQIKLLEDPDKQIYSMIHSSIIERGEQAIPVLEQAWDNSRHPLVHSRIEDLIHEINFNQISNAVKIWADSSEKDWFTILFLLSKLFFQNIEKEKLFELFSKIKNDIWLEINDNLTAFEKIQIVNHILYKKYNFLSSKTATKSASTYFLSELLSNKKGNDLSLGLFYLMICESLGMPVYGINLPGNFVLAYLGSDFLEINSKEEVLFYINPINKGTVFGMHEIDIYIEKNKLEVSDIYYHANSKKQVLEYYLNELVSTIEGEGKREKLDELGEIIKILKA